ncbi:sugar transferase [Dactylosporangium sp. CS-033363]|uniref:sugar transferase n=1 Tax=Dactylosporangium sp. CS-033363 TaxID=3239935 RepID=UPI003D8D33FE
MRKARPYPAARVLDLVGAAVLLLLLAPLAVLIAAAVKAGDATGPVLYRHHRLGRGGRPIAVLKFRTMWWSHSTGPDRPWATATEALLAMGRADLAAEYAEHHKLVADPRVTPLGRVLRRTSLDELPQLLNVLRGDLGLVGPRPVTAEELGRYGAHGDLLLAVRPGITGLWQVSGRSGIAYAERVRLDLHYVQQRGLALDLAILARTTVSVLAGRGAY